MAPYLLRNFFLAGFFLFVFSCSVLAMAPVHYLAHAFDLDSGELVYTDEYREFLDSSGALRAEVIYRDVSGEVIAEKSIFYGVPSSMPSFRFENFLTDLVAEAWVSGDVSVSYRKGIEGEPLSSRLNIPENLVVDAGFHYFVLQHWDVLLGGDRVKLNYLSPSKSRFFPLRIRKLFSESWRGRETVMFRIDVDQFVARLFVDSILLRYDLKTQQFLAYEGDVILPRERRKVSLEVQAYY